MYASKQIVTFQSVLAALDTPEADDKKTETI